MVNRQSSIVNPVGPAMKKYVFKTKEEMAAAAAGSVTQAIQHAIQAQCLVPDGGAEQQLRVGRECGELDHSRAERGAPAFESIQPALVILVIGAAERHEVGVRDQLEDEVPLGQVHDAGCGPVLQGQLDTQAGGLGMGPWVFRDRPRVRSVQGLPLGRLKTRSSRFA